MRERTGKALSPWVFAALWAFSVLGGVSTVGAEQVLPTLAQPMEAREGSFYLWAGGQARFVEIPDFRSHVAVGNSNTPRLSKDATVTTGGVTGGLGYHLPELGVGTQPRLELQFQYLSGSDRQRFNYAFEATDVFRSVDGRVSSTQAGAGTSDNTLKVSYEDIDVALQLRTDFRLTPTLTLTPALALLGGTTQTDFREEGFEAFAGGGVTSTFTRVDLSTDHYGMEVGAHLAWRATPGWVVHGGSRLGVMYEYTTLRANDCATVNIAPGACPGNGLNLFATSVRASDSTTNVRASADFGVTYRWSWAALTAQGLVSWHSDVPGARVPTGSDASPARVFYDDRLSYGGVVGIVIPFK